MPSDTFRTVAVWALSISCIAGAFMYAYLVNMAIFQAVETKHLNVSISALSDKLNGLQTQYLSLQNEATLAKAQELGLTEQSNPTFISRKPLGSGLSLRDEL